MNELTGVDRVDTTPTTGRITLNAIRTARAAFDRRVREAGANVEGAPFDDIVIAHDVTRAQLEQVPRGWLDGIKTILRGDDTLVITKLASSQHNMARNELARQLSTYTAQASAFEVAQETTLTLQDGSTQTPDVHLYLKPLVSNTLIRAYVLFEVEVRHRDMPEIIALARDSLAQLPTVERVMVITMYPPREPAFAQDRQLSVPALVVVFGRAPTETDEVEVVQVLSFGNTAVDGRVFENYVNGTVDAMSPSRVAALWLPAHLDIDNLFQQLDGLEAQADHALLEVDMPPAYRAIPIDLVKVFVEGMRGWSVNQVSSVVVAGAAAAAAGATAAE